jgi:hypothetical protein
MLRRASLPLSASSNALQNAGWQRLSSRLEAHAAFFTLPARMQAVQTRTCFLTPATTARTRLRFGFQRRRRVLFAWLITFPKCGALPQNSHFSAIFLPASIFIWAWIHRSKFRQTKLLILTDPLPPAKRGVCVPDDSADHLALSRGATTALYTLFFGTGFDPPLRTSNRSNHIEITRVAPQKERPLAARTIGDFVPPA